MCAGKPASLRFFSYSSHCSVWTRFKCHVALDTSPSLEANTGSTLPSLRHSVQQTGLTFSWEYSTPCAAFAVALSFLRARG